MSLIISFISKYFLEGIIVAAIGIATKFLSKFLSIDRIAQIKEGILTAMLYAEEAYGIGQGDEKWQLAWQKLIEILQKQGIEMSEKEMEMASIIMKANVPVVNEVTYKTAPEAEVKAHVEKLKVTRTPEMIKMIENLKNKYPKA
jgi:hypothetical protein